ncbi:enoyl-CoA hydratase/isomerase family protein [Hufsiella ginkgonis]|uniref:Enoyl-CoA hydratase n=1 Tax=Hufsiella ginkgonis TaxID=2695274 RepID=A0A7K1XTP7_9SPHI|nr:enoyl-CoA hydratase-related protein [Hufsiella ginkgonis]MXV14139.1 enoyl-CoA hydratase [Hufsiella ginkgonis]
MEYQNLLLRAADKVLTITINRPNKLNALNKETLAELNQAFTAAFADAGTRAVIITGAGPKAFVAGADISEFASFSVEEGRELAREGHTRVFDLIENGPKPVLAAINGYALGGGLELAMACHLRIAADNARLGLPEVSLGLIPGYGGTQRLTQLAGKGKALEMVLTGDMISAEEAYRTGLVNKVVPAAELQDAAKTLIGRILTRSSNSAAAAIRAINAACKDGVNGFETEIAEFGNCFGTADFKEGVSAFLEKREPKF